MTLVPGVGVVQAEKGAGNNGNSTMASDNGVVMQDKQGEKKMTSALWGLVRWDSLPAFHVRTLSVSETERGQWTAQRQQEGLRIQLPRGKRTRPAFERPCMYIHYE